MKIHTTILLTLLILSLPLAKPYKGAELRTNASYLYGRFEVRMKSAPMSGMLSSFFTFHDTPNLPAQWNEIDIETLGRYSDQTQFNVITPNIINHTKTQHLPFNPHQAFHVFAIEWTPDYIAWFVDGIEVHRQTGTHIQQMVHAQKIMMNIWPPDNPGWAGPFDPAQLPAYAYYDWVRYYAYTPGIGDNFTLIWEDDFSTWNTSRWSKATHTWYGNNADFIPQNAVFQNGYLVLCLTTETNVGYSGAPVVDVDVDAPYLGWARSYPDRVKIRFSEALDPVSAGDVANYLIPGAAVTGAHLQNDQRTVMLDVPGIDVSMAQTVVVSNISDLAQPPNTLGFAYAAVLPPLLLPVQINAGGGAWSGFIDDQVWFDSLEYGHVGGAVYHSNPTLSIAGTEADELYRSELRGVTFYRVRLAEGNYRIRLRFAETQYASAAQRVFRVYGEGQLLFDQVDIFAAVGANAAYDLTIPSLTVSDGILELYFKKIIGAPVLSALEIEPVTTGVERSRQVPETIRWAVYPNPFNPATTISFTLARSGTVSLRLFNLRGQLVRELFHKFCSAGNHRHRVRPEGLSSGVYLLSFEVDGHFRQTRKIIFLK